MSDTNTLLIEYSKNPQNKYIIKDPTIHYREQNRLCADVIEVFLRIEDSIITEWSFDGYMSIVATASSSLFGESIIGMTIDEVIHLREPYIKQFFPDGISSRRRNGSVIAILATRNALHALKEDSIQDDFSDILE